MIALDTRMIPPGLVWRRPGGAPPDGTRTVVEVALGEGCVHLRIDGRVQTVPDSAWTEFVEAAAAGEYDDTTVST